MAPQAARGPGKRPMGLCSLHGHHRVAPWTLGHEAEGPQSLWSPAPHREPQSRLLPLPLCIQHGWADGEHSRNLCSSESRSEPVMTWSAGH